MAKASSTAPVIQERPASGEPPIDLKDPAMAALLAWLVPGLGHWYQGRRSKAVLFFVCVLGTFFYGLYLGEGRVVYASWRETDWRLPYLCQVGVGVSALPALVQARRFQDPDLRAVVDQRARDGREHFWDWFMVPPSVADPNEQRNSDAPDELDKLQKRLNRFFELGTVYTMIAGLLNVLAIYDAWGGPVFGDETDEQKKKTPDEDEPADSAG